MKKFLFGFVGLFLGFSAFTMYAQENPYIVYNEGSGLITVYSTDFSYGITLQDKNLGAENVGDYGYYYQWGNNNPKTLSSPIRSAGLEWKDYYDNHGYDGEITDFIDSQGNNYTIWEGDTIHNNVWGGGDDDTSSDINIIGGYDIINHRATNEEGRQGPCPTGYHVPSVGEWMQLLKLNNISNLGGDIYYSNFVEGMKLPQGGSFDIQGMINGVHTVGTYGEYWFSSRDNDYGGTFYFDGNNSYIDLLHRDLSAACSVRCFKNNYITPDLHTVNFDPNGGENLSGSNVLSGNSIELPGTTREYYTFSGWYTEQDSGDFIGLSGTVYTPSGDVTLYAHWTPVEYEIKYEVDGGTNNQNNVSGYTVETETITLSDPVKEGYNFSGWYLDTEFTNQITEITQGTTGDITLYAKWTKIKTKPSGGSSGGGGRSSSKDVISNDSEKSSEQPVGSQVDSQPAGQVSEQAPQNDNSNTQDSSANASEGQTYTQEFQQAYEFAKGKGITTMPTIQKADMDGKLTRIAMAKMLSQYAMNVLGQKPANIVTPKFNDVSDKQNSDYDDGVTLAYQLGIMGQNMPNNKFRPNDEVTRAEFATALSRMIYHTSDGEYKSTPKYYIHHMEKLIKEGIITKDDPNMKELRGYVMIMLMRSAK